MKTFDLAVIGAGPAGYTAALGAAALGKSVLCTEREEVGGTCLNRGCIPTKAIIECALAFQKAKSLADYGVEASRPSLDYSKVLERAEAAVGQLSRGVAFLLKKAGVEYVHGTAKILSGNIVEIKSAGEFVRARAEKILIASGATQKRNPEVFQAGERVLTSREALKLQKVPQSAVVLGAGAIGLEFAWIWNAFGSKVTLVEYESRVLPSADAEISKNLERSLKRQGIQIKTGFRAKSAESSDGAVSVEIAGADGSAERISAEYALWACGMEARTEGLFEAGMEIETLKGGFLKTGPNCETSLKGVYAAGDASGAPMLAHAAMAEARTAVDAMFGGGGLRLGAIPWCVSTSPQAAGVGLSENGESLGALKIPYSANGKAAASGKTEGFLKIVFEKGTGIIKGAHILGEDASELISNFVIAVDRKLTCGDIAQMTFPHPTLGELISGAAGNAG